MSQEISRRHVLRLGGASLLLTAAQLAGAPELAAALVTVDLVIYGATSAGIVAAVQGRRMGRTVVVIEPGAHIGGLSTGGLGKTDTGIAASIGGIAAQFHRRIYAKYAGTAVTPTSPTRFLFEPHIAGAVFDDMIAEAGVPIYVGMPLSQVNRSGDRLTELVATNGQVFRGAMFIDATYEGDLMDRAAVTWTAGREPNTTYGETINGVELRDAHQFDFPISPYRTPGDPASGLLPGINPTLAPDGTGDSRIQAYNFRMCLTKAANRIRFPQPAGYDAADYELLWRYIQAGYSGPFFNTYIVGNGKTDSNNSGAFSTDHVGASDAYPTADLSTRESIVAEHRRYQQGLMWFLANDPRLPAAIRADTASWGLAADEFVDTGGWSPQLYVREARRMVSGYVMTEHDCRGSVKAVDSVGLASYLMDVHNCQRAVVDGVVKNEGDVQIKVPRPYPISYRSIVSVAGQCANLLVPVCLSASHIAYGSARMEPVFMILGQSAATAASLAIASGTSVQQVSYVALADRLRADRQFLQWPLSTPGEVIVDNASTSGVTRAGTWTRSSSSSGYFGPDYEHDGNAGKGVNRLRFRPSLPAAGTYSVYLRWTAHSNRASNVPVDIFHGNGMTTQTVDQRVSGGQWVSLGSYPFAAGTAGSVLIRTDATNGYVIADAARFVLA
ncbi:FAD-dependent oxidoreductase [Microbacterium deminutum]|uniref:FAD-dependent oxidoreductase n=1 Tax=Microbacterium deminutum TaxID=344164 RepID=A0ABN2QLI0_9MICO